MEYVLNNVHVFKNTHVMPLIRTVNGLGKKQPSRLGEMAEILNATISFDQHAIPYRPGMARKLGFVEMLQVLSGYFDERHLRGAAPNLRYDYGLAHGYGLKIAQQLPKVIDQLIAYPMTRRAIVHIGKPEDGQEIEKPCIQSYQFQIRENRLFTSVFARSWDLYSGLPYDVMTANGVSQVVAKLTGATPWSTTFFASSAHVYTKDSAKVAPWDSLYQPYNNFMIVETFEDFNAVRNWAIDELNEWSWDGGVPGGIVGG